MQRPTGKGVYAIYREPSSSRYSPLRKGVVGLRRPLPATLRWAILAALIVVLVIILITFTPAGHVLVRAFSDGASDAYTRLKIDLRASGAWGPLLSIAIVALHGIVPVPTTPILLVEVAVFGSPWGAIYAWLGLIAAGYVGYLAARIVGRPVIRRFVPLHYLARMDRWVRSQGAFGLIILRVLPFPFDPVSYAAGLAGIHPFTFGWATALGVVPGVALTDTVMIGFKHGHHHGLYISLAVVVIGGGLALIKSRLDKEAKPSKK